MSPVANAPSTATATPESFKAQLAAITSQLVGKPLNDELDAWLNREFGATSASYLALKMSCQDGVAAGWLCDREGGGIRFGRIFKPSAELHGFSVDVVDMQDIAGPHHVHPTGEIDLVMPIEGDALFDGRGAGWLVCAPGSAHRPTVSQGRALVLYLLPEGQIQFTR